MSNTVMVLNAEQTAELISALRIYLQEQASEVASTLLRKLLECSGREASE
jgi:hypothetical protein